MNYADKQKLAEKGLRILATSILKQLQQGISVEDIGDEAFDMACDIWGLFNEPPKTGKETTKGRAAATKDRARVIAWMNGLAPVRPAPRKPDDGEAAL